MDLVCRLCSLSKAEDLFSRSSRSKIGRVAECKECRNARGKAHYEANRERYKEVRANWWERSKESLKDTRANYRKAHPEIFREASRRWKESNPIKALEVNRRSNAKGRREDPGRYKAFSRKSRAKHRESLIIGVMKWRSGGGDLTVEQWRWVVSQCGDVCVRCKTPAAEVKTIYPGRADALEIDHITPVSKGGRTTASNIQPLCPACNNWKRYKTLDFRPEHLKEHFSKAA